MSAEESKLIPVNPHYLGRVVDLSSKQDIVASEDIFDSSGMKLISKGSPISGASQEKLLRFKLRKPLENSLTAADGISTDLIMAEASRLLEQNRALQFWLQSFSGNRSPLDILSHIKPNSSISLLLTLAHNSESNKLEHGVLISLFGIFLGHTAGLGDDELIATAHAALLHDIGEMYIAPEYLQPGRRLSLDEWKHVVIHPRVGQIAIQELAEYPASVSRAVGEHHERMDGSGYPHYAEGSRISRLGQIIAVAETLGGICMQPNNALHRSSLALKLVPGEYAPELVSIVSALMGVSPAEAELRQKTPLSQYAERAQSLHGKISAALELCGKIAKSLGAQSGAAKAAHQHAEQRLLTIDRSLTATGMDGASSGLALDEGDSEIFLELDVVIGELEWRVRGLARDLYLRLSNQPEPLSALFAPLIEVLEKQG